MRVNKSLLRLTLLLTLCVTLGQGHIVYDAESSQTMAEMLDLEKFFQLQDEINAISDQVEPLKGISLEVKTGIKKLFFVLNALLEFLDTHFQYTCPGNTCQVGKKCIYLGDINTYTDAEYECQNRGGQIYIPRFPDFVQILPETCPSLLQDPVWFGNYHEAGVDYFLISGLVIPPVLYDTTPGGVFVNLRDSGDANSTLAAPKTGAAACDNLVLDLSPTPASTPFYCPIAGATFKPLCEIDAYYQTFNGNPSIITNPSDEQVENVMPHDFHSMLRSGLEYVTYLRNELNK